MTHLKKASKIALLALLLILSTSLAIPSVLPIAYTSSNGLSKTHLDVEEVSVEDYFVLSPTEVEIKYDDGAAERGWYWEAGGMFAVRFTPTVSGQLVRCRFLIYSNPANLEIHVMDSSKTNIITPFIHSVTTTGWIEVDLSAKGVSVTSGVDFYIGLEWTTDNAPSLGEDTSSPTGRSWDWNGVSWTQWWEGDYMIRAYVETAVGEPDIRVEPTSLDFTYTPSTPMASNTGNQEPCGSCSGGGNQIDYPLMRPDPETFREWVWLHNTAPRAYIDPELEPMVSTPGSWSLLDHISYVPSERDQGSCGNCWVWAGTSVIEVGLDVQTGVKDRLSVQYLNSKYNGGTGPNWACCGGTLSYLADFYTGEGFAIPWSNTNAEWQDGTQTCADETTTVDWTTISTTPNYPITTCTDQSIPTHDVGASTAITNIKNVLHQNKAVFFSFFLPTTVDWDVFFDFWNTQPETTAWSPDYSCGHYADSGFGGHAVLCVGYDDTDPANSYWIMLNSWGTAAGGRPNGLFRMDMDMNYDCYFEDPDGLWWSLYWETLDITIEAAGLADTLTVYNDGTATLSVSDIATSYGVGEPIDWLSANPTTFTVPPAGSQGVTVAVDPTGLSPNTYHGYLDIYSNDPDESPLTVPVTLTVGAPAVIHTFAELGDLFISGGLFNALIVYGETSPELSDPLWGSRTIDVVGGTSIAMKFAEWASNVEPNNRLDVDVYDPMAEEFLLDYQDDPLIGVGGPNVNWAFWHYNHYIPHNPEPTSDLWAWFRWWGGTFPDSGWPEVRTYTGNSYLEYGDYSYAIVVLYWDSVYGRPVLLIAGICGPATRGACEWLAEKMNDNSILTDPTLSGCVAFVLRINRYDYTEVHVEEYIPPPP